MCTAERISYGFQDLESYSATIEVFMILNKGVSVMDGQPRCVGCANILLKISCFCHVKMVIILCGKRVMIRLMRNDLLFLTK